MSARITWNPWRGLGDLPSATWIIFVTTLVNRLGTMALPFLVLYITEGLGYGPARGGFALTIYGMGGLVSAPAAGWLSDRIGAVRVMQLSLLLSGTLLIFLPLAHSLTAVFALVLLWALIGEAVRPASQAAITRATTVAQRKAALSVYRLAINLGMSVGPAVGGFLATVSFALLFAADGITSIAAAAVLFMLVKRQAASGSAGDARTTRADATAALRDRRMLTFMAALVMCGAMFFQIEAAFPLYVVNDLGMSRAFYGLLFTINTGLIILCEIPLNLATADWPHRTALMLSCTVMAIGFGSFAFATTHATVAGSVLLLTFGEMMLFPTAAAYVSSLATPEQQGQYMGGYWIAFSLARMVGPWLGSILLENYGARTLWGTVFLCGIATAGAFGLIVSPQYSPPSNVYTGEGEPV